MPNSLVVALSLSSEGGQPTTFEAAAALEISRCWAILLQKHRVRGVNNLVEQGEAGILNRLVQDKGQRLLRAAKEQEFKVQAKEYGIPDEAIEAYLPGYGSAETVEDDLRDVVNYAILDLLLRQGWLTLPDEQHG